MFFLHLPSGTIQLSLIWPVVGIERIGFESTRFNEWRMYEILRSMINGCYAYKSYVVFAGFSFTVALRNKN